MSYADKLGIPYAVLLGEDEIAAGQVTVKDLRSGQQITVSPAMAAEAIRRGLAETGTVIVEPEQA